MYSISNKDAKCNSNGLWHYNTDIYMLLLFYLHINFQYSAHTKTKKRLHVIKFVPILNIIFQI